jgi:hypothetical protein
MYRRLAEGRAIVCTRCGLQVEPDVVCISPRGQLVCSGCIVIERAAFESAHGRSGAYYWAFASLAVGTLSVFSIMSPDRGTRAGEGLSFLAGVGALGLGFEAIGRFRLIQSWRAVGKLFPWAVAAGTGGILLGGLRVVMTAPGVGVLAATAILLLGRLQRLRRRIDR